MQIFCISLGGNHVKTLRQISAATILNLMLAAAVFAGQVDCPGAVSTTGTVTNIVTTIVQTVVNGVY
jgi:hypothetical protein